MFDFWLYLFSPFWKNVPVRCLQHFFDLSSCSQVLPSAQFGDFAQESSVSLSVWLSQHCFPFLNLLFAKLASEESLNYCHFILGHVFHREEYGGCFYWHFVLWMLPSTHTETAQASRMPVNTCTAELNNEIVQPSITLLNYAFSSQMHILFCCSQRLACGKYEEDTGRSVLRWDLFATVAWLITSVLEVSFTLNSSVF